MQHKWLHMSTYKTTHFTTLVSKFGAMLFSEFFIDFEMGFHIFKMKGSNELKLQ
jgi:hypothetical protein